MPRLRSVLAGLAMPICKHYCALTQSDDTQYSFQPKRPVIAFLGDFFSVTTIRDGATSVAKSQRFLFGELGAALCAPELIIGGHPLVSLCDLLFIPGPHDPVIGSSAALPRARLLKHVVQPLMDSLEGKDGTNPHFTTSPARLRYGHRGEMVLHRDDVLRKLRRLSRSIAPLVQMSKVVDAPSHMAKTIIDQGHLAPFAPLHSPKHWSYDHALNLCPQPNFLCLSDNTAPPFEINYSDVKFFNPGSFGLDGSFVLFRPSENMIEISSAA